MLMSDAAAVVAENHAAVQGLHAHPQSVCGARGRTVEQNPVRRIQE